MTRSHCAPDAYGTPAENHNSSEPVFKINLPARSGGGCGTYSLSTSGGGGGGTVNATLAVCCVGCEDDDYWGSQGPGGASACETEAIAQGVSVEN